MPEEPVTDDQSHYEISLTAGQAFIAFVLLLLSLAASFAFGLLIGKGQGEDRLVVKKEPAVISEGSVVTAKKPDLGKIVEISRAGVPPAEPAAVPAAAPTVTETVERRDAVPPAAETAALPTPPVYAQLLVSTDQKTAETLAATLIDKGFTSAYVERAGAQFKVRVKFPSEAEARAAEPKLKEFAKDVWIVK
jgi:sporulation related protein